MSLCIYVISLHIQHKKAQVHLLHVGIEKIHCNSTVQDAVLKEG
jgi:hypothetical protein